MKRIKAFGLLVAMATLALAAFGLPSASATTLCKVKESSCLEGNRILSGTAVEAELANEKEAVFTSGFATIKCKTSVTKGKITSSGGGEGVAVTGTFENLSWSNCTCNLGGTVEAEALGLPWGAEIKWTKENNGTMAVKNPKGRFKCAGVECTYTTASASLPVKGGSPANLEVEVSVEKVAPSSGLCSATATWKATYSVVKPNPLWVSGSPTKLCSAEPEKVGSDLICPKGKGFSGEIKGELEKGTEATLKSTEGPEGTISCNEVTLAGKFNENGTGSITSFTYGSSGGLCTSTLSGNPEVKVEVENLPYDQTAIIYEQSTAPQGTIELAGAAGPPTKTIHIGAVKCVYRFIQRVEKWENGKMVAKITWRLLAEDPMNNPGKCIVQFDEDVEPIIKQAGGANLFLAKS